MSEKIIDIKTSSTFADAKKYFYNLLTVFYLTAIIVFAHALISWSWYKLDSVILAIWAFSSVCGTAYVIFDDLFYQIRINYKNLVVLEEGHKKLDITLLNKALQFTFKDLVLGLLLGIMLLLTFPFWFLLDKFDN